MSRRRAGFTLLELIVVVAVLAALAGLVINKVDWIRRQATMAAGAATSGDVANNIQEYLASTSTLPSGLDSLIVSGSGTSGGTLYQGLIGTVDAVGNLPTILAPTQITYSTTGTVDKRLNSLVRMGMRFVNNHNATSPNATDSGTVAVALDNFYPGPATGAVAPTTSPVTLALVTGGTSSGLGIWNAVYPQNVWNPSGTAIGTTMVIDSLGNYVSLVALGVGPGNSMNGVTMATPPQFAGPDSNLFYYRYVAIFSVYSDGRRAQLKTVIEPFGRTIDSSLSNFATSGPDEAPPGSRTPE